MKTKVMRPKMTNGSYLCSHSSKLFNGNKMFLHTIKVCFKSSVRYLISLERREESFRDWRREKQAWIFTSVGSEDFFVAESPAPNDIDRSKRKGSRRVDNQEKFHRVYWLTERELNKDNAENRKSICPNSKAIIRLRLKRWTRRTTLLSKFKIQGDWTEEVIGFVCGWQREKKGTISLVLVISHRRQVSIRGR